MCSLPAIRLQPDRRRPGVLLQFIRRLYDNHHCSLPILIHRVLPPSRRCLDAAGV